MAGCATYTPASLQEATEQSGWRNVGDDECGWSHPGGWCWAPGTGWHPIPDAGRYRAHSASTGRAIQPFFLSAQEVFVGGLYRVNVRYRI